ncbi:hypothetical protein EVJ58_g6827 [Rhodofomes roseus]|uniref:Endonuclease/exonuclease/phosphatase domain-containing protein n=1 Tax=Rhodofomes roseus TaxID=34475 RepID=A0A4Y9Y6E8_9APHY|nr:hypothetical protein EVJ58_g6827 [Rhodofomes roseus]
MSTTTTRPIRIIQLNANTQNRAIHSLLNQAAGEGSYDIALITEPWWGEIGGGTQGPVAESAAGWTPILPVSAVPTGRRPRAMAYTRKRDDFTITLRSDLADDLDLQILEVAQTPHPPTLLVNVYNDDKKQGRKSAMKRLQKITLPTDIPVIISGDLNLHHPLWTKHGEPAKASTEQTVDWLAEKGFLLKNKRGEPTFYSHAHKSFSTLDLTFVNPRAMELDAAKKWAIDESQAHGSDHFALRWELDYGATEVDNISGVKYNFKDTDEKEWRDAFRTALLTHDDELSILLDKDAMLTPEQLDRAAEGLTEAMQEANIKAAKIRKPSNKARPWWTPELQQANARVASQRSQNLAHHRQWGVQSTDITTQIKKSRSYFKRLYKKARSNWVTETLEKATSKDIWGFSKWGKGIRTYQSPAISRGPDKAPAVSHTEKCDALRDELFQPPPPLEGIPEPDLDTVHAEDLPDVPVTSEEVRSSIFEQGADKAAGMSQCQFRILRWSWQVAEEVETALMHHCLKTGYHPKSWRKAIAVALPKPRKPDYTNPRAYRLIQLLECLGKALERIVAMRLAYLVSTLNLVPANQFGGL